MVFKPLKYARRACELTHYGVTVSSGPWRQLAPRRDDLTMRLRRRRKPAALASAAGEQDLLGKNQQLLALYRAHQNRIMRRPKSLFPTRPSDHAPLRG